MSSHADPFGPASCRPASGLVLRVIARLWGVALLVAGMVFMVSLIGSDGPIALIKLAIALGFVIAGAALSGKTRRT